MRARLGGTVALICVALAACGAPVAAPLLAQRLTLSCTIAFQITVGGVPQLADQSVRTVWLDLEHARYSISELGDTRIDYEWAQAMGGLLAEHGGFAPIARRAGTFVCLTQGQDGQCVHGVDVDRRTYAFSTPVAQEGGDATGLMQGRGRCAEVADIAWPVSNEGAGP